MIYPLIETDFTRAVFISTSKRFLLYEAFNHYVIDEKYEQMIDRWMDAEDGLPTGDHIPRIPDANHWKYLTAEEESHDDWLIVSFRDLDINIPFKVCRAGRQLVLAFPLDAYSEDIYDAWAHLLTDRHMEELGLYVNERGYFCYDLVTIDPPSWQVYRFGRSLKNVEHQEVHTDARQIADEWRTLRIANEYQRWSRNSPLTGESDFYLIDHLTGRGAPIYGTKTVFKDGAVGYGVWSISKTGELYNDFSYHGASDKSGLGNAVLLAGIELAKKLNCDTVNLGERRDDLKWKKNWTKDRHRYRPELVIDPESNVYKALWDARKCRFPDISF